jgi:ribosome production factor 2
MLKKSGSRVPRVELEEIGPSLNLVMRRTKLASDDLYRTARRQPEAAKV